MHERESWRTVSEAEFRNALAKLLKPYLGQFKAVCGPGRSGAVAAVYASHFLHIPYIPIHNVANTNLRPLLLIDTACESGATMRKAVRWCNPQKHLFVYKEPPRVKFWYEVWEDVG